MTSVIQASLSIDRQMRILPSQGLQLGIDLALAELVAIVIRVVVMILLIGRFETGEG